MLPNCSCEIGLQAVSLWPGTDFQHLCSPALQPAHEGAIMKGFAGRLILTVSFALVVALSAHGQTFITPSGSVAGGQPVDASAMFTLGSGTLDLTLTNLEANPSSVVQNLSDFSFTLSGITTGVSLTGASSSALRSVAGNGSFTDASGPTTPAAVGWAFSTSGGSYTLEVLSGPGHAGPAQTIIGPPGGGGTYSNANGSIAGNGPHNPFLDQSITFVFSIPGLTSSTEILNPTFSFGTTAGVDIVGVPLSPVPEPRTIFLIVGGILAMAIMVLR